MDRLIDRMTQDYLDDVLVRLAHHSSAIEGNTITLLETATIILNQTLPNNENITRREFYEVDNHQQAFAYILERLANKESLSLAIIKDIHEKLTDRLQHDKGQFKKDENVIKGTDFSTAAPEQVLQLMDQLIGNLEFRLRNSASDEDKVKAILEAHIQFEKIHPFSDGNGRTGRMVMNYSLLENNLPPLIIRKKDKNTYMRILGEAQADDFPNDEEVNKFMEFTKPLLEEEKKRIIAFTNQKKQRIDNIVETTHDTNRRETLTRKRNGS